MLDEQNIEYRYREYTKDPLSQREIKALLRKLDLPVREVLRKNDKAFKENRLTGDEPEARLIHLISIHPTLLRRPIGVTNDKAVIGRPVDRLLELV